ALRRLSGQLLAEVDEARLKFEESFLAWRNGNQAWQYLLRGKDLRLVDHHEGQIPWGREAELKQKFLGRSRRRRLTIRLGLFAALAVLAGAGWFGKRQVDRFVGQTYLMAESDYPPELYDWQDQLQYLKLETPLNFARFPWLRSDRLEELALKGANNSYS